MSAKRTRKLFRRRTMSDHLEPGIYPCVVSTHGGPENHCCLWDGAQWLWLDSSLEWDPVGDSNCRVISWNYNLPDTVSRAASDVLKERYRQDMKWGGPTHDDEHSAEDWERFIMKRIPLISAMDAPFRQRMVEIAALAVAAIESHDRISEIPKPSPRKKVKRGK